MRRHQDFVPRPQFHREMQQLHAGGPRRSQHRVFAPGEASQFALELLALRTQDEAAGVQHPEHSLAYFLVDERL